MLSIYYNTNTYGIVINILSHLYQCVKVTVKYLFYEIQI